MKLKIKTVVVVLMGLSFLPVQAQMGAGGKGKGGVAPGAPEFSATFSKLFGEHKAFSANVKTEVTQTAEGQTLTMPMKLAVLEGKRRMEMDLTQSKGPQIPPGMAEQLKAMGMGEMTAISAPGKDLVVYPGLKAYAEIAAPDANANDESKLKMAATEVGKETIEGHPCVKNKVTVTDAEGKTSEAMVWNATDLKKFPVRIDTGDENAKMKMIFTDVKLEKPEAKLFEAPAGYKRYTSIEAMMQEAIMKRMQEGGMPK